MVEQFQGYAVIPGGVSAELTQRALAEFDRLFSDPAVPRSRPNVVEFYEPDAAATPAIAEVFGIVGQHKGLACSIQC